MTPREHLYKQKIREGAAALREALNAVDGSEDDKEFNFDTESDYVERALRSMESLAWRLPGD